MKTLDNGQLLAAWSKVPSTAKTMIRAFGAFALAANFALEFAKDHPHNLYWVIVQVATIFLGFLCVAPELVLLALEKVPLPEKWTR